MKTIFKEKDWCFCEFKLQQIQNIQEDGRITSVSDGLFNHGGYELNDRCYPLEMKIKTISDTVAYWSKTFHALENNALNHLDLNRALIKRWIDLCDNKDDDVMLSELYDSLSTFGNAVVSKVRDFGYEEVDGIPIFRR